VRAWWRLRVDETPGDPPPVLIRQVLADIVVLVEGIVGTAIDLIDFVETLPPH
jgi:hypothetical protein